MAQGLSLFQNVWHALRHKGRARGTFHALPIVRACHPEFSAITKCRPPRAANRVKTARRRRGRVFPIGKLNAERPLQPVCPLEWAGPVRLNRPILPSGRFTRRSSGTPKRLLDEARTRALNRRANRRIGSWALPPAKKVRTGEHSSPCTG